MKWRELEVRAENDGPATTTTDAKRDMPLVLSGRMKLHFLH